MAEFSEARGAGRPFAANVFSERSWPTSYFYRSITEGSPYSAFYLFIDNYMLKVIAIVNHGKMDDDDDDFSLRLDFQLARGSISYEKHIYRTLE